MKGIMNQFGIELNMVVETQLSLDELNSQFIKWVELNGWSCGGRMRVVDENGSTVLDRDNKMLLVLN